MDRLCRDVGDYKLQNGIPMMLQARVQEVKDHCTRPAEAHAVDPMFARRLYGLMIEEACRLEDEIIDGTPTGVPRAP